LLTTATIPAAAAAAAAGPSIAAQGRLVGAAGRPVAGARIVLYAWPADSVVSRLRPGQRVPLRIVGTARTTALGGYAIRVTSPAALRASAARDGTLNLELITTTPAGFATFSFHRRLAATLQGSSAARMTPQAANLRLMPAGTAPRSPQIQCGLMHEVASYGARTTTVGTTYSHVPGVTAHFTYGSGQSSGLGVGVSSSGSFGTWSASGTHSVSSDSSESFPTFSGARSDHERTEFVYKKFLIECDGYQTQATSFAGGATHTTATPPSAGFCVAQAVDTSFTKHSTSAFTFTGGVSMSGAIGVDLSAHTGYSTTAELTYSFTQRRDLCGTNDYPGGTPKRLVAGDG